MQHYLNPKTILEPLICQWYAWIATVSPLTAGFYFQQRYLKLLNSFIEYPEVHEEASKNPSLAGGSFVNLSSEQCEEVKQLLTKMKSKLASLIDLSNDIADINKQLIKSAKGQSLEQFYSLIPESLQGAIELLYDIHDRASLRFIEPILYHRFYEPSLQSLMLSCNDDIDHRSFTLSTPRLAKTGDIHLNIPFSSAIIDTLAASKETGLDFDELCTKFGFTAANKENFKKLFTQEKPDIPFDRNYYGNGIRIRYFGHACILIQTQHTSILIDPFISYGTTSNHQRYNYFDLPDTIDYVLISHAHQDHITLETLLQIRHKVKRIIVPRNSGGFLEDPSIHLMLQQTGFNHIESIGEFDKIQINDITITGLPFLGEHGDLNIQSKLAYHLSIQDASFLFAVDSNNLDPRLYTEIRNMMGEVDTVFIGMECKGAPYSWLYGSLSPHLIQQDYDQSRRLSGSNAEKAANLVNALDAKNAYIYAMGLEPWLSHITGIAENETSLPILESNKFLEWCNAKGISCLRLFLKHEYEII